MLLALYVLEVVLVLLLANLAVVVLGLRLRGLKAFLIVVLNAAILR